MNIIGIILFTICALCLIALLTSEDIVDSDFGQQAWSLSLVILVLSVCWFFFVWGMIS